MMPPDLPVLDTLAAAETELKGSTPVLFLLWNDQAPRRDAEIALKTAADKHRGRLRAFLVDARHDPALVERFDLGKNAVLVGWYGGQEYTRRSRPWEADVTGIADEVAALVPVPVPAEPAEQSPAPKNGNDRPVTVTDATFADLVINSKLPVVVDFWAGWCQPCKMVAPILEKLAKEFAGRVRVAKVDVDANQMLASQFGIQSIPTMMFVKNGKIVGQSAGAAPEGALRDAFNQLIALQV